MRMEADSYDLGLRASNRITREKEPDPEDDVATQGGRGAGEAISSKICDVFHAKPTGAADYINADTCLFESVVRELAVLDEDGMQQVQTFIKMVKQHQQAREAAHIINVPMMRSQSLDSRTDLPLRSVNHKSPVEDTSDGVEALARNQRSDPEFLKRDLIRHLERQSFVKLAPSRINGCGVIAIRTIPAGIDPFHYPNPFLKSEEISVSVSESELKNVPPMVLEMLKSFFAPETEEDNETPYMPNGELVYGINATGMNSLDLGWYLNHSEDPNLEFIDAPDYERFCSYVTRREIAKNEELTINYRELGREYYALVQSIT